MLQIDTYRGSVEQLTSFLNEVWTESYAGKMTIPSWNCSYLSWQFRLNVDPSRRNLIAAYDGDTLGAVLLGTSYPYRSPAGLHGGSQWSWLSVHKNYRGQGITPALDRERIARQKATGSKLIVSYRYIGSRYSLAERPQHMVRDQKFNRKIGFWARVLNPDKFLQWHWNRAEGYLSKAVMPLFPVPASARTDIQVRPFVWDDLDVCLNLVHETNAKLVLSIAWDHDSLSHQLGSNGFSQTLVVEEAGRVTGFVNFHLLKFRARTIETVAVIDMIVIGKASSRSRTRLLNAAPSANAGSRSHSGIKSPQR